MLVLDVYRQAFEPYWAPTSLLLAAMSLPDPASGRSRGYCMSTVGLDEDKIRKYIRE